jgi:hypothetical protein
LGTFAPGLHYPPWLLTQERYCLGRSDGDTRWSSIRLKHLAWRRWQADFFVQAKSVS